MTMLFLLAGGLASLFAASLWSSRAGEIALRQRSALIDFIYEQPDWPLVSLEFDAVGFRQHYRRVLLCRNPADLYPPRLGAVLRRPL